jgi:uncharacterized delta-60 repeat protein
MNMILAFFKKLKSLKSGKKLVFTCWIIITGTVLFFPEKSFSQPGFLDLTFGNDGIVNPVFTGDESGVDHHVFNDGKILQIANFYKDGFTAGIFLIRYNSDGTQDQSFGVNGLVKDSLQDCMIMWGQQMSVQDNGSILISGGCWGEVSTDFLVMKFHPDGSRDITFGINGIARATFEDYGWAMGYGMAVQPDGKIIVTGNVSPYCGIIRFNADGTLDNSFGTNGKTLVDFPGDGTDFSFTVGILSTGKIIVSGFISGNSDIPAVACLNSDGTVDNLFGNQGYMIYNNVDADIFALAVQPDDKIIISGSNLSIRIMPDGSADYSYGIEGVAAFNIPSGYDYANVTSIALQNDGKIILCGSVGNSQSYSTDLLVVRVDNNGLEDLDFGNNGIAEIIHIAPEHNIAYSISVDNNAKITVTGGIVFSDNKDQIILARYHSSPVGFSDNANRLAYLSIFPNPAEDVLNIRSGPDNQLHLEISTTSGQTIIEKETSNPLTQLDIRGLKPGVYFLKYIESGEKYTQVFIKK